MRQIIYCCQTSVKSCTFFSFSMLLWYELLEKEGGGGGQLQNKSREL